MAKFHINKHGMPAPCRAKPGNCPLGGDENHYNTKEEAQAVVDKANEQKYGLVSGLNAVQHSKGYLKLNDLMEKGEFFKLEKEAVLLNAKDVEGVYNAIQDLRDENGSIEKSYKSIQEERNNLYSQKHEIKEEIEKDIYENGEKGQKLKQQKEKIDEIEKQNEENIKEANEKNSGDCPKCGEGKLVERRGKYGPFIGCNNFPKCNHTQKIAKAKIIPTGGEHHKYGILKSQLKQEVDKASLENPRIQKLNKQITELNKKIFSCKICK